MTDEAPAPRRPGARRAERSSRLVRPTNERGGARAHRLLPRRRRTHGLPGTIGMTVLGGLVPGSGYLYAGRRALGVVVLAAWLVVGGALLWFLVHDNFYEIKQIAFSPTTLKVVAALLALSVLVWAFVVLTSHRLVRPRNRPRWHTALGYAVALVVVVVGAAPVLRVAQYALVTADTVETLFPDHVDSATTPDATAEDPWAGQDRVNVLLLGGDGGEDRTGVRTDTVILASMDTTTGRTTLFSLPRNLMYAEFPDDSPLHDLYPDGYRTDQGDPSYDMLNAIYGQVPALNPGVLGKTDNEGADAVKLAVSGSLGVPVDYYALIDIEGFKTVVDAMGGITVNVNQPVAINGNTDLGIPPTGYIEPGPDQHLDGFHALWFARGRYGSDDYQRMDRQRCAINALVDAADPVTLFQRYIDLAKAGKQIVTTDIPRSLGPAFVDLLLKVKDSKLRSVVFRSSENFNSGDPDYDYVRSVVQKALDPPKNKRGKARNEKESEDPVDVCAYDPDSSLTATD